MAADRALAIIGGGAGGAVVPGDGHRTRRHTCVGELEGDRWRRNAAARSVEVVGLATPGIDDLTAHIGQRPQGDGDRAGGVADGADTVLRAGPLQHARAVVAQVVPLSLGAVAHLNRAGRRAGHDGQDVVVRAALDVDPDARCVSHTDRRGGGPEGDGLAARIGRRTRCQRDLAPPIVHSAHYGRTRQQVATVVDKRRTADGDREGSRLNGVAHRQHGRGIERDRGGVGHRAVVGLDEGFRGTACGEIEQRRLRLRRGHELREHAGDAGGHITDRNRLGRLDHAAVLGGIGHHGVAGLGLAARHCEQAIRRRAREVVAQRVRQVAGDHHRLVVLDAAARAKAEGTRFRLDARNADVLRILVGQTFVHHEEQGLADGRQLRAHTLEELDAALARDVVLKQKAVPHRTFVEVGLDAVARVGSAVEHFLGGEDGDGHARIDGRIGHHHVATQIGVSGVGLDAREHLAQVHAPARTIQFRDVVEQRVARAVHDDVGGGRAAAFCDVVHHLTGDQLHVACKNGHGILQ